MYLPPLINRKIGKRKVAKMAKVFCLFSRNQITRLRKQEKERKITKPNRC
jgi:hypothetical protein